MRYVLIAGLWLDGPSAWDPVIPYLRAGGHDSEAVTLPGQGDGSTTATLEDQVAAVLAAVDAGDGPSVVVGHSAACTLAWIAADRRPDSVIAVQLIGGFPTDDGGIYTDFFAPVDGQIRFPGWQAFEGPDSADLDAEARQRIAADAIPVPAGVQAPVRLSNPRRFDIPVRLICPEYSPEDAREWISSGEVPALEGATLEYVNIDSGHWPMFTRPAELAEIITPAMTQTKPLGPDTWEDFAGIVERNNGIYGGCWCAPFHAEYRRHTGMTAVENRDFKHHLVTTGAAHACLVFDADGVARGWCQYDRPEGLNLKHRRAYEKDPPPRPDWRLGCIFVDRTHRGQGIARAAVSGALEQIAAAGGGRVEAISEVTAGRTAQGRFLFSATVELFESLGFTRVRPVGKHAWIVVANLGAR